MTNIILIVSAILLGFTFHEGRIIIENWPFPALLVVIGIYSYFFSKKLYERFCWHDKLSDQYREIIELKYPDCAVGRSAAKEELTKQFGIIHHQPLNAYWKGVPLAIFIIGAGSLALIASKYICS